MSWYHKLFGLCDHKWKEISREYHPPTRGTFKNLYPEQLNMYLTGWTVFLYECENCGKTTTGQQTGNWTKDKD